MAKKKKKQPRYVPASRSGENVGEKTAVSQTCPLELGNWDEAESSWYRDQGYNGLLLRGSSPLLRGNGFRAPQTFLTDHIGSIGSKCTFLPSSPLPQPRCPSVSIGFPVLQPQGAIIVLTQDLRDATRRRSDQSRCYLCQRNCKPDL